LRAIGENSPKIVVNSSKSFAAVADLRETGNSKLPWGNVSIRKDWGSTGRCRELNQLLRQIEIELDGHTFTAPVAWPQTDFCQKILLGREVVFDLFDLEFKQAEERIIFKWRSQ
jgi:hypothetical protein